MLKKIIQKVLIAGALLIFFSNFLVSSVNAQGGGGCPGPSGGTVYGCYCTDSCNTNADCWNATDCWCNTDPTACSTPTNTCFPSGTKITLSDGQSKNIEEVKTDDIVLSQDENGEKTSSTVKKVISPISDNMCQINFEDGDSLSVTKSHPLFTDKGWRAIDSDAAILENSELSVSNLLIGDKLLKENGEQVTVKSIACRSEKIQTYNLTVDNAHTFYADSILVHNKGNNNNSCISGVSCPTGYTTAWNQPYYSDSCDQSSPQTCSLGNAQSYGSCCTAGCGRRIVNTFKCCAPGTSDQCVVSDSGTTYVKKQKWQYANTCSDSEGIDVVLSSVHSTSLSDRYTHVQICDDPDHPGCYWYDEYYYNVTCEDYVKTCTCTPTCTAAAPVQPTLLSPSNGGTVSTGTVSLTWDATNQDWGTSCVANSNSFEIYIGTSQNSLSLIGTKASGTGNSVSFSAGSAGTTYYWKVRAKNGSLQTDSNVWSFTVNNGPWWQTKDGDISTNSDITSDVPTGQLFSAVGLGGFPGLPAYGTTFNLTSTPSLISTKYWNANTTSTQPRLFNYSYFKNLIPDEVGSNITTATDTSLRSSGYSYDGYEWFKSNGNLTIGSDLDFGNRKVILFVENGNLNVNGKINLNNGLGFFGAFVNGSIVVDSSVTGSPSIEGLFETDSGLSTGNGTTQLHIRGSVASYGTMNLERDLTNNANPAELFEFAPDLLLNFPAGLGFRRSKWTEVAP